MAVGSIGGTWLALTVSMRNWAFATGLLALVAAWISTTGMAWYAIRHRMIEIHKEWMIRAYVVTFAFVTFRIFSTTIPVSLVPRRDLIGALAWACWAIPLLITEVALQANKMRKAPRPEICAQTAV